VSAAVEKPDMATVVKTPDMTIAPAPAPDVVSVILTIFKNKPTGIIAQIGQEIRDLPGHEGIKLKTLLKKVADEYGLYLTFEGHEYTCTSRQEHAAAEERPLAIKVTSTKYRESHDPRDYGGYPGGHGGYPGGHGGHGGYPGGHGGYPGGHGGYPGGHGGYPGGHGGAHRSFGPPSVVVIQLPLQHNAHTGSW